MVSTLSVLHVYLRIPTDPQPAENRSGPRGLNDRHIVGRQLSVQPPVYQHSHSASTCYLTARVIAGVDSWYPISY